MQYHRDRLGGGALAGVVLRSTAVPGDERRAARARPRVAGSLLQPWAALGIAEEGASAQAVAARRRASCGGRRERSLNLARRPFRNERLPTSSSPPPAWPSRWPPRATSWWRETCPGPRARRRSQVVVLEGEIAALRAESAELLRLEASPDALRSGRRWGARGSAGLLLTGLFAALEKACRPE